MKNMKNIKFKIGKRIYPKLYPSVLPNLISYEVFDAVVIERTVLNGSSQLHAIIRKNRLIF